MYFLPVIHNDLQVGVWEFPIAYKLENIIIHVLVCFMEIEHQQQAVVLHPEAAGMKSFVSLFDIVDYVENQPFF